MRREFAVSVDDLLFLDKRGKPWEAIVDGGGNWLLMQGFEVPAGYTVVEATAAVQFVMGYPDIQLDMMYFEPHLTRQDGRQIGALSAQTIDGRNFQRWSRHRPSTSPWRVGEDNLATHCLYAHSWLTDEFNKR